MFDLKACNLELSLQIAFSGHKTAWGYKSDKDKLVFCWTADDTFIPFVTPIGWEQAVDIVKGWCKDVADYGTEPDNDGHSSKSWRIYCDYWGHVDRNWKAFAAVEPYWAEFGK